MCRLGSIGRASAVALVAAASAAGANASDAAGPDIQVAAGVVEAARDGRCSLVEAMLNANSASDTTGGECIAGRAGSNRIVLLGSPYVLTQPYEPHRAASAPDVPQREFAVYLPISLRDPRWGPSGLPPVTSEMEIAGLEGVTISRDADADAFRLLEVAPGGALTLDWVNLERGSAAPAPFTDGLGGAVLVCGGTLVMTIGFLDSCQAGDGGALAVVSGRAVLSEAYFEKNSATGDGGAILVGDPRSADGAGDIAALELRGRVSLNEAGGFGGGIAVLGRRSRLDMTDGTIPNNKAAGQGGALFVSGGTANLIDVEMDGNTATGGGGAAFDAEAYGDLQSVAVTTNHATEGGGLSVSGGSTVVAKSCAISDNIGELRGGGALNDGGWLAIDRSGFDRNSAFYGRANGYGGGICNAHGTARLLRSSLTGNEAYTAGGLFNGGDASMTLSTIAENTSHACAGGIFHTGGPGTLLVSASTIARNGALFSTEPTAPECEGAGITFHYVGRSASGGLASAMFEPRIVGSIVADNSGSTDCAGWPLVSLGYNVETGTSCGFTARGDLQTADAGLYGQWLVRGTISIGLEADSPAIDRVPRGIAECAVGEDQTDQRGSPRPIPPSGRCDSGALEYEW